MNREIALRNRPTQARSLKRLEMILDTAGAILEREGPSALNTNHIARLSGVPVASLYHYFPNKHAILAALGERWLDRVVAAVDQAEASHPPEAGLLAFMDACLVGLADAYQRTAGLEALMHEMSLLPELRTLEDQHDRRAVRRIADILHQGGIRATASELHDMAEIVVLAGHALLVMLRGKPEESRAQALAEMQLLWRSYLGARLG
jgi:AcrR family transcriptional regulator